MPKVAVAGGSAGIGKAIVDAIEQDGSYEYIILSRTPNDHSRTRAVDYSSVGSLQSLLEDEGIHTVISALSMYTAAGAESQLNLIEAANRSRSTQRFVPSEFGIVVTPEYNSKNPNPTFPRKLKALGRLDETTLEYTLLSTGIFLDYTVWPQIPSEMPQIPLAWWVDLPHNLAAIPGTGEETVVLTHTRDIGTFVAAALSLPAWEKRYTIIGDRLSFHEFVKIAEEVKGAKFEKYYDSEESLLQGKATVFLKDGETVPEMVQTDLQKTVSSVGLLVAQGAANLDPQLSLNKIFPEIKTLSVRKAIEIWKSK